MTQFFPDTQTFTIQSPPAAVTGLVASQVSSSSITLSWNAVPGAASYLVTGTGLPNTDPLVPTVTYDNLLPSTEYTFTVQAVSAGGRGTAATVTLTTQAETLALGQIIAVVGATETAFSAFPNAWGSIGNGPPQVTVQNVGEAAGHLVVRGHFFVPFDRVVSGNPYPAPQYDPTFSAWWTLAAEQLAAQIGASGLNGLGPATSGSWYLAPVGEVAADCGTVAGGGSVTVPVPLVAGDGGYTLAQAQTYTPYMWVLSVGVVDAAGNVTLEDPPIVVFSGYYTGGG